MFMGEVYVIMQRFEYIILEQKSGRNRLDNLREQFDKKVKKEMNKCEKSLNEFLQYMKILQYIKSLKIKKRISNGK